MSHTMQAYIDELRKVSRNIPRYDSFSKTISTILPHNMASVEFNYNVKVHHGVALAENETRLLQVQCIDKNHIRLVVRDINEASVREWIPGTRLIIRKGWNCARFLEIAQEEGEVEDFIALIKRRSLISQKSEIFSRTLSQFTKSETTGLSLVELEIDILPMHEAFVDADIHFEYKPPKVSFARIRSSMITSSASSCGWTGCETQGMTRFNVYSFNYNSLTHSAKDRDIVLKRENSGNRMINVICHDCFGKINAGFRYALEFSWQLDITKLEFFIDGEILMNYDISLETSERETGETAPKQLLPEALLMVVPLGGIITVNLYSRVEIIFGYKLQGSLQASAQGEFEKSVRIGIYMNPRSGKMEHEITQRSSDSMIPLIYTKSAVNAEFWSLLRFGIRASLGPASLSGFINGKLSTELSKSVSTTFDKDSLCAKDSISYGVFGEVFASLIIDELQFFGFSYDLFGSLPKNVAEHTISDKKSLWQKSNDGDMKCMPIRDKPSSDRSSILLPNEEDFMREVEIPFTDTNPSMTLTIGLGKVVNFNACGGYKAYFMVYRRNTWKYDFFNEYLVYHSEEMSCTQLREERFYTFQIPGFSIGRDNIVIYLYINDGYIYDSLATKWEIDPTRLSTITGIEDGLDVRKLYRNNDGYELDIIWKNKREPGMINLRAGQIPIRKINLNDGNCLYLSMKRMLSSFDRVMEEWSSARNNFMFRLIFTEDSVIYNSDAVLAWSGNPTAASRVPNPSDVNPKGKRTMKPGTTVSHDVGRLASQAYFSVCPKNGYLSMEFLETTEEAVVPIQYFHLTDFDANQRRDETVERSKSVLYITETGVPSDIYALQIETFASTPPKTETTAGQVFIYLMKKHSDYWINVDGAYLPFYTSTGTKELALRLDKYLHPNWMSVEWRLKLIIYGTDAVNFKTKVVKIEKSQLDTLQFHEHMLFSSPNSFQFDNLDHYTIHEIVAVRDMPEEIIGIEFVPQREPRPGYPTTTLCAWMNRHFQPKDPAMYRCRSITLLNKSLWLPHQFLLNSIPNGPVGQSENSFITIRGNGFRSLSLNIFRKTLRSIRTNPKALLTHDAVSTFYMGDLDVGFDMYRFDIDLYYSTHSEQFISCRGQPGTCSIPLQLKLYSLNTFENDAPVTTLLTSESQNRHPIFIERSTDPSIPRRQIALQVICDTTCKNMISWQPDRDYFFAVRFNVFKSISTDLNSEVEVKTRSNELSVVKIPSQQLKQFAQNRPVLINRTARSTNMFLFTHDPGM